MLLLHITHRILVKYKTLKIAPDLSRRLSYINENYTTQHTRTRTRYTRIHHIKYACVVGMGEVVAVLNGVQFKSRHNDYALSSPSRTSDAYMQQQYIGYTLTPPRITRRILLYLSTTISLYIYPCISFSIFLLFKY